MFDKSATPFVCRRSAVFLALMCTSALVSAPALAGGALPSGGQFVAGQGAIAKKGTNGLSIRQNSQTGIIDWRGFSIGAGNAVRFNNGSGATLNRVTGGNLSQIDGSLHATGSVYLINPQGVVVGPRGKVVTNGSFVASTRDISDSDFLNNKKMTASGKSKGDVVNAGVISSANGDAILVGRSVTNNGVLSARNGTATMAAANRVVLQPVGSGVAVAVFGGKGDVTNAGTVKAAQADLASAGGNVYALAGNNGVVRATGTATINGHVWLTSGGNTEIAGTVSAQNADGSGGDVTVRAADVNITGKVDASATQSRKSGGTVSLVARGTTDFSGAISARGGKAGKGGAVETSGAHVHVADGATVDTLSLHGTTGSWLIDPNDFIIAASGGDITGAALSSNLGTTDVSISSNDGTVVTTAGHGDIFVSDDVSWSSGHSLTLDAVRNIDFNANVTATGTSAGLVLTYGGAENFAPGKSVTLSGASATLNINSTPYTLLHTITDVQNVSSDLTGHYALAEDIDASATSGWNSGHGFLPLGNGTTAFSGDFDGFGHTIDELTINNNTGIPVGLFGVADGATIENVGLVGGSVTGGVEGAGFGGQTGALVGHFDDGTIFNSFAMTNVTGGRDDAGTPRVGGLVGQSGIDGTITDSYATGMVLSFGTTFVGGLVGDNEGTINNSYATGYVSGGTEGSQGGGLAGVNEGAISNSYALGVVDDSDFGDSAGGLVGANGGSIDHSYAAGMVVGSSYTGGLVAQNTNGGTVTHSYWDSEASGVNVGIGHDTNAQTVAGKTTAQLQAALQSDFSSSDWSIVAGKSYPYLNWQFNGTPDAVSGTFFRSNGVPFDFAEAPIDALAGGEIIASARSNANGYYYFLFSPDLINAAGNSVLLYQPKLGPANLASATFQDGLTSSLTGVDIHEGSLILSTVASAYSTVLAELSSAIGSNTDVQTAIDGLGNLVVDAARGLTVDSAINRAGNVTITTHAGNLNVTQALVASGTVTLASSSKILESGVGKIKANTLTGSSKGTANFADGNTVSLLGDFDTSGGAFALKNVADLTVTGPIDTGTGRLTLTTAGAGNNIALQNTLNAGTVVLSSGGTISSSSAGIITAAALTGTSHGDTSLGALNDIAKLGAFTTNSGAFGLRDNADLTVDGVVNAGNGTISLTTSGTNHSLAIKSSLTTKGSAGAVSLQVSGSATETNAGAIVTHRLDVTAKTGIKLTSPKNDIKVLGTHTTKTGPNQVTL
ncbi:MAG TPA: filamentous hemagglutinin N-terminal domain-containing protein [Rhizomicrobium sp.]|jgi:filamentous hemagglutinin family protein